MPRKTFVDGQTLPASDLNNFLMNQSVMTFSNAAARTAAITSPVEGQVTYLEDSASYQYWDSSAWVGLVPQSANAIINGAFDIWQRGTSFSTLPNYTADRWAVDFNGSGGTRTASQQSFTPGTAPELGYEGQFFFRLAQSVAGTGGTYNQIKQPIEDVRTFAGQTVTFSFWAKAAASTVIGTRYIRFYGSGGSTAEEVSFGSPITLSTSWTRYTRTFTLPTLSGKTLGANSFLQMIFDMPLNSTFTVDIWGVQLEAGPTATPFRRNANSLQGELAACQRYYIRYAGGKVYSGYGAGFIYSSTRADIILQLPVQMRVLPYAVDFGNLGLTDSALVPYSISNAVIDVDYSGPLNVDVVVTSSGLTANRPARLQNANNVNGFIGLSSEL